jgi:hypothetical protein
MNIRAKIFGQDSLAESPLVRVKNPKGATADAILSIPVERQFGRTSDTRLEHRFPLAGETSTVLRDGKLHEIRVVNVCGGGAMITAAFKPMLWERLQLNLGQHGSVLCSVIWIRNGRLGLEFAEETRLDCAEDDQAALLREVILRHFPGTAFESRPVAEAVDPEEHRREVRHPFIWSGTLHCEYGSTPARLRNVSPEGAMIETSFELSPGAEPYLDLGEAGSVFATVAWTAGDQSGLAFQERFDLARLAHARPSVAGEGEQLIRFGSSSRAEPQPQPQPKDSWPRTVMKELGR